MEFNESSKIKKAAIFAIASDEYLMNKLVLKGGTCIELAYELSHRASKDIDFSIEDEFTLEELESLKDRILSAFQVEFGKIGYHVFDLKIENRPLRLPDNIKMSGYELIFKYISLDLYKKMKGDLPAMQRRCPKFSIDISKFEYVKGKELKEFDGHKLYIYSPELIVCEKLRAICQKMKEYRTQPNCIDEPRARDFYDIYNICINIQKINFKNPDSRETIKQVFKAKDVDLNLLIKIKEKRAIHEADFKNVMLTDVKNKRLPEMFDFYFEYVLDLIKDLEEFWIV